MADAPWRCSQCGTVNEPVANACRACGRWPSLFDLERSTIKDEPLTYDEADEYAPTTVDVEVAEPEIYEPMVGEVEPPRAEPISDEEMVVDEVEEPKPVWQRLASLLVPIGVVVYIVINAFLSSD